MEINLQQVAIINSYCEVNLVERRTIDEHLHNSALAEQPQ